MIVWISRWDLDMELVGFSYLTIVPKPYCTNLPPPPQGALHFSLSNITTSTFVVVIFPAPPTCPLQPMPQSPRDFQPM